MPLTTGGERMFSKKTYSGIDIKEKVINLVSVKFGKEGPQITKLESLSVKEEPLEGGSVTDSEELTNLLKGLRKKKKKFGKQIHLSIPTQRVILRQIDTLPDLPEKDLERLLAFEIGESIHLPFDSPIYDYVKVGTIEVAQINEADSFDLMAEQMDGEDELGPRSKVLLIATSHDVSSYISRSIKKSGFKPLSAEIRATALQRLINFLHPQWLEETEALLDISQDSADLHFFHQGTLAFTRNIAISKSSYTKRSRDFLSFDEVATTMEQGVQKQLYNQEKAVKETDKATREWDEEGYLEDVFNEIQRAQNFFFYTLKQGDKSFKQTIVTGEFTDSLVENISKRISYPVVTLDFTPLVSKELKNKSLLHQSLMHQCSVAIGLALRGEYKPTKKK
jgi:type IV pilus assembly protein PilM